MAQTCIDQSIDNADLTNDNFTFIQATQRTKYELCECIFYIKSSCTKHVFKKITTRTSSLIKIR